MRLIDIDVLPNYEIEGPAVMGEKSIGRRKMRFAFWEDIEKAPIVDAVPVVHSFWFGLAPGPHPGIGYGICGHCHQRITLGDHKNRCPNCGAIMDQEAPQTPDQRRQIITDRLALLTIHADQAQRRYYKEMESIKKERAALELDWKKINEEEGVKE